MGELLKLVWCAVVELNVLRRRSSKRLAFGNVDRIVFAELYRLAPAGRAENREARDGNAVASGRIPGLLTLEVATER